ncbi:hypothetical protein EDC01DRAFT_780339 [Geopyxis carbonaria]|nr:hypothetical protein EDC01DRAFT_780339 [Geopyxis carbonaria]
MKAPILTLLLATLPLLTASAPIIDDTEGPVSTETLSATDIAHPASEPLTFLALPDSFDYTALPTNGTLPYSSPLLTNITTAPAAAADPIITLHCQTSSASPAAAAVWRNGRYIQDHSNTWCCQRSPRCTRLTELFSTKTDICGNRGHCVACWWAGHANKWIASSCKNAKTAKAGGYVRFGGGWVDVNAYWFFGDREGVEGGDQEGGVGGRG